MTTTAAADVQALVLAAGRSTRIAGELGGRSKLLVDLGGETVIERNLRWLASSGVTWAWINLHYRPDDITGVVGDGAACGLRVRYSFEPELRGTAGAFRALATEWQGPVVVVYGDNVNGFALGPMLHRHRAAGGIATIALFDAGLHANSGMAGGRVVVDDGRVTRFVEGGAAVSPLVNAGVYVLEPRAIRYIAADGAPDFGRDVFPAMIAAGETIAAHVIERDGYCFGIDTPEALARTRAALAEAPEVRP
jgi:mannose-1-phosphate guanylyltransferase